MIKLLGSVLPVTDYYSEILGVEVGSAPIQTPTHISRVLSSPHFAWLTQRMGLMPSTLVRAGLETSSAGSGGHLIMPVPFFPGCHFSFTDSGGFPIPSPKAVIWPPQAVASEFQKDNGLLGDEHPREWGTVNDYFSAEFERRGLGSDLAAQVLLSAGLEDHYNALRFGAVDLHMDIWDCLAVAQAREAQLLELCYAMQTSLLAASSADRIDSLLRTYEPLPPLLFACVPTGEEVLDPHSIVSLLAQVIDLTARSVIVTVFPAQSCDWSYWLFLLSLHYALSASGATLLLRLLPESLALTVGRGVPVSLTPQLVVSRFGPKAYFDAPLRCVAEHRVGLSPKDLWEQQPAELRGESSLLELLTEEVICPS